MLKRNNIYLQSYLKNDQLRTYVDKMQEQNKYNMSSCAVYQSTVVTKNFVEEQRLYCFIVSVKEKASLLFGR